MFMHIQIERINNLSKFLITLFCIFAIAGCTGATRLPTPSTTTEDVLQSYQSSRVKQRPVIHGRAVEQDPDYRGYTSLVTDELNAHFRYIPNPVITIYIFQHLTPQGAPVPGYASFFKMYQQDQLAKPGELSNVRH